MHSKKIKVKTCWQINKPSNIFFSILPMYILSDSTHFYLRIFMYTYYPDKNYEIIMLKRYSPCFFFYLAVNKLITDKVQPFFFLNSWISGKKRSSSSVADCMDFPLSPPSLIIHCPWHLFQTMSCVCTELMYISSCSSANTSMSICRCP